MHRSLVQAIAGRLLPACLAFAGLLAGGCGQDVRTFDPPSSAFHLGELKADVIEIERIAGENAQLVPGLLGQLLEKIGRLRSERASELDADQQGILADLESKANELKGTLAGSPGDAAVRSGAKELLEIAERIPGEAQFD